MKKNQKPSAKKNGGHRPGSGRKPGVLGLKAQTLLEVKNRIAQKADHLLNAEFIEALGSHVVMKADPETLEYRRVTDENEIVRFIQEYKGANGEIDGKLYVLAVKPGNYKSRQYLFDRVYGRPSQSVEITKDPEVAHLKSLVEARAHEKGVDFKAELELFINNYAPPELKDKLASELGAIG